MKEDIIIILNKMNIYVDNHKSQYEIQSVAGMFLKDKSFNIILGHPQDDVEYIYSSLKKDLSIQESPRYTAVVEIKLQGKIIKKTNNMTNYIEHQNQDSENKYVFSRLTYEILSEYFKKKLDWGILTGVRPVKLVTNRLQDGYTKKDILDDFEKRFLVTKKRSNLAYIIGENQMSIINNVDKKGYSLYISIPFCPSRCYYCSFISSDITKNQKLIIPYVKNLIKEIKHTSEVVKNLNLNLKTIYFGGGTPTAIPIKSLEEIILSIKENFNLDFLEEFTIEAGRPDTITFENLSLFKNLGVDRISINPQTLNDKTLNAIGREHSVADFYNAYNIAEKIGFNTVNTDLIAGLKGETFADYKNTAEKILELSPKNITLHTLSVKKASELIETDNGYVKGEAKEMMDYSYDIFMKNHYKPYYLYRQKNSRDNLENIGFSKKGGVCRYNILMMEELQSVIACGAGGVTKIVKDRSNIHRIFNYKFPHLYLENFEEMIKRKDLIYKYY